MVADMLSRELAKIALFIKSWVAVLRIVFAAKRVKKKKQVVRNLERVRVIGCNNPFVNSVWYVDGK